MADKTLAKRLIAGERRALARAITVIESRRADHREQANGLLEAARATGRQALRIGLSGTPGVGKSTFIEAFGLMLTGQGLRVAVLAVDPSSVRSGGSIMGDKTRMERLSRETNAFVRPSPNQTVLGGVARHTGEAVLLCEGAGFDVVLTETVGVGQSEIAVAQMTDIFLLLLAPAGGDELQGIKRGIMEIADMILINKADGDLQAAATRTVADYSGALGLLRARACDPEGYPCVMPVSALTGAGLTDVWRAICELADWRKAHGFWQTRRNAQAVQGFEDAVRLGLLAPLDMGAIQAETARLRGDIASGEITPEAAATALLHQLKKL